MRKRSITGRSPTGTFHRMSYTEWGAMDAPVLMCVHGLTRNGRDFDPLAHRFQDDFRVICPDIVGRGDSDWLTDPEQYGYPQYLADLTALIAWLDVASVAWLGTSMGALLGMFMAAGANSPVTRLLMNDAGPVIARSALARIAAYLSEPVAFADVADAEAYFRRVHAPFGNLTDAQWQDLTRHSIRESGKGGYDLKYDPNIAVPFASAIDKDIVLWPVWDAVTCPVTVIRGAQSDLLSGATASEMAARGPQAVVHEIPGVGHAPALMDKSQLDIVSEWLKMA